MKSFLVIFCLAVLSVSCLSAPPPDSHSPETLGSPSLEIHSTTAHSVWGIYDPDPEHIWNRVFRQFYRRVTADGTEYGMDELDPLLWLDTTHLLSGDSHAQALQVLDEFLSVHGAEQIHDPLKRALFQRDLWAVFDWLAVQSEPYPAERLDLQTRLTQVLKAVALTREQVSSLPDTYALAVKSESFPADFQVEDPQAAFLPADLFQENSAWIPMGRVGGPIAMSHTQEFPFFGRSVFLVFVRAPDGRESTVEFIQALNVDPDSISTVGLDVALVRRALLIDEHGELVLSPLIETVQLRHFNPNQIFHEFELDRRQLLFGMKSSFHLKDELFLLFFSHGDMFEVEGISNLQATLPQICKACHFNEPPLPNYGNLQSIISYSRSNFSLPGDERPVMFPTTWTAETELVIQWKQSHSTWQAFENFLSEQNP